MKILWLVNIPLPEVSLLLGEKPLPFGGWLINASKYLSMLTDVELSIVFPSDKAEKIDILKGEKINYYLFKPMKLFDSKRIENNEVFENILKLVKPEIVHIFGTELAHSLSMANMCKKINIETVISIQGLVSIYSNHMFSGLPCRVIYMRTLRDFLKNDSIKRYSMTFEKRGKNEINALKSTKNIIGRTTWDKACSSQINPDAKYFHCDEILRESFYHYTWDIDRCEKYSIFLSQAQYSIKGAHFVLEALPLVINKYPETKVYISGINVARANTFKEKMSISSYGKYLRKLIKKFGLSEKVIFTGPLSEKQMCERFLKSHVFVSPSTVENESNSLSEAKILGVPSIVSYVGGTTDRVQHNVDGFHYQHDAPYMLAYYICEIFKSESLALQLSRNAKINALKIHNKDQNIRRLLEIYQDILKNK